MVLENVERGLGERRAVNAQERVGAIDTKTAVHREDRPERVETKYRQEGIYGKDG